MFVGRGEERAAILSCVTAASAGQPGVVWIEGDPGSGKTALLRSIVGALPPGFGMIRADADELAADVSLAVAGQLGPLAASEGFAAGLELLQLFARRQAAGPVAVVVEDLHWADTTSRQALLTAARRLDGDKVVLLLTSRPDSEIADGWERFRLDQDRCLRVRLGGLSEAEVAELAASAGLPLTSGEAGRLHHHTRGHPLHVGTLLGELTREQLAGVDGELPAPRSLASTTIARLAELPAEAQDLGCALAVLNQRIPLQAAARVGGVRQPARALEGLLATGFVTWQPGDPQTPVEFAHPLFRAAVYADLAPTRRRELHRAAAAVVDTAAAWAHRVAAADGADDVLADELSQAAGRERAQPGTSGLALAARYLLWASSLTCGPDRAEGRLLEAMRLLLADGQTARAGTLRHRAEACGIGSLRNLVLGMLAWTEGDAGAAERWLLSVPALGDQDADGEVRAAALAQLGTLYSTRGRAREAVDVAARALSLRPADPGVERVAWTALAFGEGLLRGAPAALDCLAERLTQPPGLVPASDADLLVVRGMLGYYGGRVAVATADLRAAIGLARQGSAFTQLPRAHLHLGQLLFISGDWDEALLHGRVTLSLVADERLVWMQAQAHAALGSILAARGEWDAATRHMTAAHDAAEQVGAFEAGFMARIAEAALARARNDPGRIVDALTPLAAGGDPRKVPMLSSLGWWPVLIEAVADCGDIDAADRQVSQLEQGAQARGLDMRARISGLRARVALARGRPDDAAAGFAEAVALTGNDDPLLDRALLHHAFGRLLLARGSRRPAMEQFRAAHGLLAAAGADPYLRRVETDIEASGVRAAPGRARSPLALTGREHDVAVLAGKGLTNREVAAELYVSEKAVQYHLGNIFAKLGITSRRQLRNRQLD